MIICGGAWDLLLILRSETTLVGLEGLYKVAGIHIQSKCIYLLPELFNFVKYFATLVLLVKSSFDIHFPFL